MYDYNDRSSDGITIETRRNQIFSLSLGVRFASHFGKRREVSRIDDGSTTGELRLELRVSLGLLFAAKLKFA